MPVVVRLDVPVSERRSIECHLDVRSVPAQAGAWHWLSDTEVHWRPRRYWQPGTRVTVDADVDSVRAGDGVWGQVSRKVSFTVGATVVHRVDVDAHLMRTYVDGELARTIPVSAGDVVEVTGTERRMTLENGFGDWNLSFRDYRQGSALA